MKKALVKQTQWVKEDEFMDILSLAQILPGATGVSLMGYWGFKFKGVIGWVISWGLYILPAFLFTTILAQLYFQYNDISLIQKLFAGLGALVVALLFNAVLQLSKPVFGKLDKRDYKGFAIALATFCLSIFLPSINTVFVILLAGILGILFYYFTGEYESIQKTQNIQRTRISFSEVFDKQTLLLISLGLVVALGLWLSGSILWSLFSTFFQLVLLPLGVDLQPYR